MWNENDWYYPEMEPRYRPALGWIRRPPRFPPPYARPPDMPPFMKPEMGMIGMGIPPFRTPRMPPDMATPHAGPALAPPPLRPIRSAHPPLYQDFSAPARPAPISMNVQTSALKCLIEWKMPPLPKTLKYTFKMEIWEGVQCEVFDLPAHAVSHKVKTTPGGWYKVELTARDVNGTIVAMGRIRFKAVFSHEEMQQMYKKAIDYVGTVMHSFRFLYRCKPKVYYDDIQYRCGGLMEKYLKDNNGQAASSINGAISGLFFSARLLPDGSLPSHSPFGNVRMLIPAVTLIDPNRINMYFCDFYCNYLTHYITVVVCEKRSDTDVFCMQRLIKLQPDSNPFLRILVRPPLYEPEFWVNKNVWVEIYYTESVPLAWGRFDTILATGAGTSRVGGLPHNKQCNLCNLYPLKTFSQSSKEHLTSKLNSTFELLLALEQKRVGANIVGESADLIETICSLIDAVVDQNADLSSDVNGNECEGESGKKFIESASSVMKRVEKEVTTSEMKLLTALLREAVEHLDRNFQRIEEQLGVAKQSAERFLTLVH
uniref:Phytanoyl-CoA hydroxylase-interacting protein-like C-terminal domain-containing protein n=1 Tax=Parascaris univalens TaxID=6257 RepID=A0A915AWH4_PARUN